MQPQMVCLRYAETRKWAALNSTVNGDTDPKDAARAHYLPFQWLSVYYNIYTSKIEQIYDNKIVEFTYKFLHFNLKNNLAVSKWNKTACRCLFCRLEKYHVLELLGLHDENNSKTQIFNNFTSFPCYTCTCSIYKYKMKCWFEEVHVQRKFNSKIKVSSYIRQKCAIICKRTSRE